MKSVTPTLLSSLLLALTMALSSANLFAAKDIVKWVDSKGVTHYSDKPPMPENALQSKRLNKHGVTIETIDNRPAKNVELTETKQTLQTQRYDHALINSYGSVDEIEIARKRNVKTDELALESLEQKQKKLQASSQNQNAQKSAALENVALQIQLKEKAIAATNERYMKDTLRYRELTSGNE